MLRTPLCALRKKYFSLVTALKFDNQAVHCIVVLHRRKAYSLQPQSNKELRLYKK